ncbi:endonuclease/exonuclease/phosphatase (EEP) superfamily protein YafD [Halopolyspora algeriensis]|uniref:Endonuclease/exonuclease/phosphatase (EEP) superfamily protein YafD n=1 Tax=Halopolyspora algeriensis TaxID=1500506 RepID=A0A368VFT6_9ACTN|nr:endonuclease/exonuclease/phosphatase family protein [Halopolyspora algeriensis]RCW40156.1 endonuclease/exonuclease/phosphatase (EEP) superfamily protein YafD [Halopolyspora algeriensis]TQM46362.1 endonuclease/exonuclease/phosphatase (EEP) superfamily protein YafD [Halopolyspora algeriensis]
MHEATEVSRTDAAEPAGERRHRRPGGTTVTVLLSLCALPYLAWASLRLVGLDTNRYTAALVALTQYAVPVGAILFVAALLLRRWLTTVALGVVTAILALSVAPRAIPDEPVPVRGEPVTVLSVNVYFGKADPARIVELVRRHGVDVLGLQELTPQLVTALDEAGLAEVLPHRVFEIRPDAAGAGIVSRYPLRELSLVRRTTMSQPSTRVDLPGPRDMEFVAAHPTIPVGDGTASTWRREIAALPPPVSGRQEPARVLAGDFNATLDHSPLRNLLGRGYADAAEVTGNGLQPTWPMNGRPLVPPVTIDHVLVSGGTVVRGYRTFAVDGTDHRAVLAHLVVPR